MMPKSSQNDPKVIPKWLLSNPQVTPVSDIHDMHVMHVMHAFHACHARMSRISRPCAQFRPCSPCSIRPLETHFRRYFRALGEGSVPIGGNSFELSASSSHRWAGSSVPPAPVFSSLWRSIGRDSGAILSKNGHQCASCSIRPWEMSFLTPFSTIISPN